MGFKILRSIRITTFYKFFWAFIGFILFALGASMEIEYFYTIFYIKYPILLVLPPLVTILGLILIVKNIEHAFGLILDYFTTKQICLIHRGEIKGKKYLCPNCLTKYCSNCFNSVVLADNKCWTCNYDFIKGDNTEKIEKKPEDEPAIGK
jgi:hypothetical protein